MKFKEKIIEVMKVIMICKMHVKVDQTFDKNSVKILKRILQKLKAGYDIDIERAKKIKAQILNLTTEENGEKENGK